MNIWAVANQKGGGGKTTSTVSLAGLLSAKGYRTLVVDMDPHGSLTVYFGHDPDTIEMSVYSLFQVPNMATSDMPRRVIKQTRFEGLDLLPASTAMATLDRQLGTQDGKGLVLLRALQQLADSYDYVLIDCPPILGVLMVNAMAACQSLLIPVQTEFLALKGLERMMRTTAMITRARRAPLGLHIVPTMFDRRTRASHEALKQLQKDYPEQLWDAVIPIDTQFREASRKGVPLPIMRANSRGSIAYRELLTWLQNIYPADSRTAES